MVVEILIVNLYRPTSAVELAVILNLAKDIVPLLKVFVGTETLATVGYVLNTLNPDDAVSPDEPWLIVLPELWPTPCVPVESAPS